MNYERDEGFWIKPGGPRQSRTYGVIDNAKFIIEQGNAEDPPTLELDLSLMLSGGGYVHWVFTRIVDFIELFNKANARTVDDLIQTPILVDFTGDTTWGSTITAFGVECRLVVRPPK